MTAFEDFIQAELPNRPVLLKPSNTGGYDDNPNDVGAPPILVGAPTGTLYLRETPRILYQKTSLGTYEEIVDFSVGAGGGSPVKTAEDLNIPVDPTGILVPSGAVFQTQLDVDAALGVASGFQFLEEVINALPFFINHRVDINMSAGIHRPIPGRDPFVFFWAIQPNPLFINEFIGGSLNINGAPPSQWDPQFGLNDLVIQSHDTGATFSPSYTFSGTPFTGLDLRGLYVVSGTGQVQLIWRHTNNVLEVTNPISPVPVNGVTTIDVARPSTIIQNSVDGLTAAQYFFCMILNNANSDSFSGMFLQDITVEGFGGPSLELRGGRYNITHLLHDYTAHSGIVPPDGYALSFSGTNSGAILTRFSFRTPNTGADQSILESGAGGCFLDGCYFLNGANSSEDGVQALGFFRMFQTVFDNHTLVFNKNSSYFFDAPFPGFVMPSRFVNTDNLHDACVIFSGCKNSFVPPFGMSLRFENNACPLIDIRNQAICDFRPFGGPGMIDSGGNTAPGYVITGSYSIADLDSNTLGDGTITIDGVNGPEGAVPNNTAPLFTTRFNRVSKG